MYFPGHNGFLFNLVGLIHPRFRTLLLPRYIANKKGRTLTLRIGTPLTTKALEPFSTDDVQLIKYMRFRSYLLAERETHRTRRFITLNPPMMPPDPIIAPIPADVLTAEIARLPEANLLIASGDLSVYIAAAEQIPACLREIGRLREVAFRAVGEGTGNAIDLDDFDNYYNHLFIWNAARQEIIGSYRLGLTDEILTEHGVKGLYTRTLFKFDERLMERSRQPSRWDAPSSAPNTRRPIPRFSCCGKGSPLHRTQPALPRALRPGQHHQRVPRSLALHDPRLDAPNLHGGRSGASGQAEVPAQAAAAFGVVSRSTPSISTTLTK